MPGPGIEEWFLIDSKGEIIATNLSKPKAQMIAKVSDQRNELMSAMKQIADHYSKATPAGIVARDVITRFES